ncbi:DUF1826 domain-containing protein [Methylophilus sp. 13]|uniref:DUF1826 domain-containing protein n=1 Tax=Methylophilus sp. 13 TaxID=2781018 RepID=UPI00188E7BEE|nr:DUF1826 domain-containing protein [Methylophilus sp. 13]MBF5038098.1 DUF1826 domain-containing protein [Methylophilus sp. 13]
MLSVASSPQTASLAPALTPASEPLTFNPLQMLPIFEPEQQVCLVRREAQTAISDYLQLAARSLAPGLRNVISLQPALAPQLRALPLPAQPGREAFIQELAQLVTVFAELLDCQTVGLRLEVLQKAMCPQFHVDHTGIRLLCTYMGPGTEWLEEAFADRSYLKHRSHLNPPGLNNQQRAGVVLDARGIRQADAFDIVLLKGSQWQGNTVGGAIHRSPVVPEGQTRVVLALDAIRD